MSSLISSGMDARSSAEGVVCPAISRLMRTSSRSVFSPKVGKGMSRGAAISSAEAMQTAQRPRSATRIWTSRLPYRTAHHLASAKNPTGNVSASAQSIGDSDVFQLEARFISGKRPPPAPSGRIASDGGPSSRSDGGTLPACSRKGIRRFMLWHRPTSCIPSRHAPPLPHRP